jgi:hypothetical protein
MADISAHARVRKYPPSLCVPSTDSPRAGHGIRRCPWQLRWWREAFTAAVRALPGHWIANEDPDVLTYRTLPAPPDEALRNVLALDGTALAWTRSHGQAITWFG